MTPSPQFVGPIRPPLRPEAAMPERPTLGTGEPEHPNPLIAEIDRAHQALSPDAQTAIKQAHGMAPPPAQPAGDAGMSATGQPNEVNAMGLRGLSMGATQPAGAVATDPQAALLKPIAPTPAQTDLTRLTAPPQAHDRTNQGQSGIAQIHNPWARVPLQILDAVGRGLFPGIEMAIPGTSGHHDVAVHQARKSVEDEQGIAKAGQEATHAADVSRAAEDAHGMVPTETALKTAQAHKAEADAAEGAAPHTLQTAEGIKQWNPATRRFDIPVGSVADKNEGETVTTDQGVMQWDPKTKTYSVRVGDAPDKTHQTLQDADGNWYAIKDGQATPVTVNGQAFKGKTTDERTSDQKNYEAAKAEGFKGTFNEWLTQDANRKAPRPNTTIVQQGDKLLTPQEAAMLGVPYGTTREQAAGKQPATEAQKTTANYASRVAQSNDILSGIEGDLLEQGAMNQWMQGKLPDFWKSDLTQSFEQAKKNFINAILRRESGAAISPAEFREGESQYFPIPGNDQKILNQKRQNRDLVLRNLISASGNAYEAPPNMSSVGAPRVSTAEEYKAITPGSQYVDTRDGKTKVKGGTGDAGR